MQTWVGYPRVRRQHPIEMAQLMAKLRGSSSRSRNAFGSDIKWDYVWHVETRHYSVEEVADGIPAQVQCEEDALTDDELIALLLGRTRIQLQASIGHWWGRETLLSGVPSEVVEIVTERVHTARAEKSAEEKKQRLEKLLPTPEETFNALDE